jgi:hypothetical protein
MVAVRIADRLYCTTKYWYLVMGDNTHIYNWLDENIGEDRWYFEPEDMSLHFIDEEDAFAFKIMFAYFCK